MKPYIPATSEIERRAYQAAHAILAAQFNTHIYAAPSKRRQITVDGMAQIIQHHFEGIAIPRISIEVTPAEVLLLAEHQGLAGAT